MLENTTLKEQIRDLIEENDLLKNQINSLMEENKNLQERAAKISIHANTHNNGGVTHREVSRFFDNCDVSGFDIDKSGYDTNQALDIKKLMTLKEEYPDLFNEKIIQSHKRIEKELHAVKNEAKKFKRMTYQYKEENQILKDNMKKLERDFYKLEERDKISKTKIRTWGDGTGTPFYEDVRIGESKSPVQQI